MNKFELFVSASLDALRNGAGIERDRSVRLCQLLELPSRGNPMSWDVVHVGVRGDEAAHARLYRSCWRKDIDLAGLRSIGTNDKYCYDQHPSIELEWTLVDCGKVEMLIDQVRNSRVSLCVADPLRGCDGATYELAIGGAWCTSRLTWWQHLPQEWRKLEPFVHELRELFEATWAART